MVTFEGVLLVGDTPFLPFDPVGVDGERDKGFRVPII